MIDPLGPDPSDPRMPARHVGEILPEAPIASSSSKSAAPVAIASAEPDPPAGPEPAAPTALARPRPTGLQRAISVAKTVLPLVGKVLPLLEGNVVATASNLLTPHQHEVNLKPIEEAITSLQADQRALTFHTSEHKRTLRRLEDEFAALGEAVEKNAAGQAQLVEQVATLEKRNARFVRVIVSLLILSLLSSAALALRLANIIRF
jgi:hypothetical protein